MKVDAEKVKSDFFIAISNKVCELKKSSLIFSLTKLLSLPGNSLQIEVTGKEKKLFTLSFDDKSFFLDNPEEKKEGGRPMFSMNDMVTYLLILANGDPVAGKLTMPGIEKKRFRHLESINPT